MALGMGRERIWAAELVTMTGTEEHPWGDIFWWRGHRFGGGRQCQAVVGIKGDLVMKGLKNAGLRSLDVT